MLKAENLYGRPWIEKDYIIALHYYFQNRGNPRDENSRYVKDLSALLGRTPASVIMRMENYASMDSAETRVRKGLDHINPLGQEIFRSWVRKKNSLRQCAEAFIRDLEKSNPEPLFQSPTAKIRKAFGKYELYEQLADGNFGTVYSCLNVRTGKRYAIKVIRTDKIDDSEALSRFRREIKTLRKIRHPNVIRILGHNLGIRKRFPAFVMDYAECSLADYIRNRTPKKSGSSERALLPLAEAIDIFRSVLTGVEALHGNKPQVIHRDINPSNILRLPNETWVLADFNLAKFLPPNSTTTYKTHTYQSWGTEFYSAPEQWSDFKGANVQADLYSLGILIWELFCPSWPSLHHPVTGMPASLQRIFAKATEREPQLRHSSVGEFRRDFEEAIAIELKDKQTKNN